MTWEIQKPLMAVMLLASGCFLTDAKAGWLDRLEQAREAPSLELEDIEGKPHSLQALRGSVVLVNFWATWCAPCLEEMPSISRLREQIRNPRLVILGINVQETTRRVQRFSQRLGVGFPVLLDRSGQAFRTWGVKVYPTSFLIDGAGRIRYQAIGPVEWDGSAEIDALNALLEELETDEP